MSHKVVRGTFIGGVFGIGSPVSFDLPFARRCQQKINEDSF